MDGRLLVKAGQMWLNDLGGLGSVGGGMVEYGRPPIRPAGSDGARAGSAASSPRS